MWQIRAESYNLWEVRHVLGSSAAPGTVFYVKRLTMTDLRIAGLSKWFTHLASPAAVATGPVARSPGGPACSQDPLRTSTTLGTVVD